MASEVLTPDDGACHACGHHHPIMSRASLMRSGDCLTRFFCHENDHSCYNEKRGRYFDDLEQPLPGRSFEDRLPSQIEGLRRDLEKLGALAPKCQTIRVMFDGAPGPVGGRFIEVETPEGAGVNVGEWIECADGRWALELKVTE